jgi:hypothetical protein
MKRAAPLGWAALDLHLAYDWFLFVSDDLHGQPNLEKVLKSENLNKHNDKGETGKYGHTFN